MHVMVIGAAGMIGRKLVESWPRSPDVWDARSPAWTLADVAEPPVPPALSSLATTLAIDLSTKGSAERLISSRPDVISHLAAIVSGEAEADFDKGYLVISTARVRSSRRSAGEGQRERYLPRVSSASSIAVFGQPFPEKIGDEFLTTPLTSYGTQKGDLRAAARRLYPPRLLRRYRHSAADHLHTARKSRTRPHPASFPTSCASRFVGQEAILRWTRMFRIGSRARARRGLLHPCGANGYRYHRTAAEPHHAGASALSARR